MRTPTRGAPPFDGSGHGKTAACSRAYLAITRLTLEGQPVHFDLVASMYAVITGEVAGPCAAILTACALTGLDQYPHLLPSLGQQTPMTVDGLIACFRRLIDEGFCVPDDREALSVSASYSQPTDSHEPFPLPGKTSGSAVNRSSPLPGGRGPPRPARSSPSRPPPHSRPTHASWPAVAVPGPRGAAAGSAAVHSGGRRDG